MNRPSKENLGSVPEKIVDALFLCLDWTWAGLAWAFARRFKKPDLEEFINALKEYTK